MLTRQIRLDSELCLRKTLVTLPKLLVSLRSGRVLNVLEGGYGIPCCRPQSDEKPAAADDANTESVVPPTRPQPARLLDFGDDLPDDIDDQVMLALQKRLEIVFCGRINRVLQQTPNRWYSIITIKEQQQQLQTTQEARSQHVVGVTALLRTPYTLTEAWSA